MELASVRLGLRREQDRMTQAMSTSINAWIREGWKPAWLDISMDGGWLDNT